ncbi:hypothetical protein B0T24DRAFT_705186 [Lasiosphaeria ovina]|uniref:Uncharacterized protein n=1 Tax=Lasiosphaeria ovina TaxID=92902 RepID=A0AAE0K6V4_9PEZI|nr:hypothetical protein B0T24DRAFT_705186 [Lasiosphaeria ovina]
MSFRPVRLHCCWSKDDDGPVAITETTPFVSNIYMVVTDMGSFMRRARDLFGSHTLLKYRLGPRTSYIIHGQRNIQVLFRPRADMGSEGFIVYSKLNLGGMDEQDVQRFMQDHSGRHHVPNPGTEALYDEHLSKAHSASALASKFYEIFDQRLDPLPARRMDPNMIDTFWEFDRIAFSLLYGLPRWMKASRWRVREKFFASSTQYLDAAREEAMQALVTDAAKLVTLPLLQSIYVETLRLHFSMAITRKTKAAIVLERHQIPKGSFVQALTPISHFDDTVWAKDGRPATEFWVGRYLNYRQESGLGAGVLDDRQDGCLVSIWHFAKQEMMIITAAIITRFDIEFVQWARFDGTKSDREARGDENYAGSAAMPPDREMKPSLPHTQKIMANGRNNRHKNYQPNTSQPGNETTAGDGKKLRAIYDAIDEAILSGISKVRIQSIIDAAMAATSLPSTPAPVAATPASGSNHNPEDRQIKPPLANLRPTPKGPSNWKPPRNPRAFGPIKAEPDTKLDRTMTTYAPPPTNTGTDAQGRWYPRNFTGLANGPPSGSNMASTVAMPLPSIQGGFGGFGSASDTSASSALQKRKQGFLSPDPTPKRRQT